MGKKYYLVIDTETLGQSRKVYDVGAVIMDRKGNIVERYNALVDEVVNQPTFALDIRADKFASKKADFYLNAINESKVDIEILASIKAYIDYLIQEYNATVVAYNAAFDVRALNKMAQCLWGENFFADDVEVFDLWNMALNAICGTKRYINYALTNDNLTDKGYIGTSAESVYQYLTDDNEFVEDHTALSDALIESAILARVFKTHKKMVTEQAHPCNDAWNLIQRRAGLK